MFFSINDMKIVVISYFFGEVTDCNHLYQPYCVEARYFVVRVAVAGCGFLGGFGTCRGYWATAVLSGNQWSVDTANELIIAYGSKPVARAALQETIGCIIQKTKDKSNIRYAKHIVKLQITKGT